MAVAGGRERGDGCVVGSRLVWWPRKIVVVYSSGNRSRAKHALIKRKKKHHSLL